MSQARILLVDDHSLVREALAECLEREPTLTVVGQASNADDAIEVARRTTPDLVVMDIDMPGRLSFDAAGVITSIVPGVKLVFLSAYVSDGYVNEALRLSAMGYLTKSEPTQDIVAAIRQVAANRAVFSQEVSARIIFEPGHTRLAHTGESRMSTLTPREVEVLRYISHGSSKKHIAEFMHLSVKTVDNHTQNLMRKLDIHDRVELARFAIREGIVRA